MMPLGILANLKFLHMAPQQPKITAHAHSHSPRFMEKKRSGSPAIGVIRLKGGAQFKPKRDDRKGIGMPKGMTDTCTVLDPSWVTCGSKPLVLSFKQGLSTSG